MPGFEDWSGRTFELVNLTDTVWKETDLVNARFSGRIDGLVINDIEVAPLIEAELDRRFPERLRLQVETEADVDRAWATVEELWAADKAIAATLPESVLQAPLREGEWSWAENFRHLVMVTDAWIARRALGRDDPFHPWGVPPSFMTGLPGIDTRARPAWDEIVPVRDERVAFVRAHLEGIDLECLRVVLDEEWAHHWYATRDLDRPQSAR
ncbi:MAG TPA: DinB family protein [Acidimicrobiales bacterium]|nr:DinB family protein [Acidimicrobiales bacterium]